ncbi:MAG: phenylalanine--tRNA ligase subunit alpha, partial [Ferruginibacter sp.]
MEDLVNKIESWKAEISGAALATSEEQEQFRIRYLGTKGLVKSAFGEMKNVAPENKKAAGQILNDFKVFTENIYNTAQHSLAGPKTAAPEIDVT